ncbi:MAG TPA: VOC family protein [Candidatus Limnocylindrales bacterium]|nr:VOC family protein [Candidatus Limnocylindrales bacterium]
MSDYISPYEFKASEGVEDWRVIGDGMCAYFATGSFERGAQLVAAIAKLPDVEPRRPDVDLRHDGVTVRLLTYAEDWYGPSRRDVAMARAISATARELGLTADPGMVQSVLIIPGSLAPAEVMPFWQAVLGYELRADSPEEDLIDPRWRWPGLWFEEMDDPRPDAGGSIHVAVWLPEEHVAARVEAALAAGGRVVREGPEGAWWTLADAAGNECDVASIKGRG